MSLSGANIKQGAKNILSPQFTQISLKRVWICFWAFVFREIVGVAFEKAWLKYEQLFRWAFVLVQRPATSVNMLHLSCLLKKIGKIEHFGPVLFFAPDRRKFALMGQTWSDQQKKIFTTRFNLFWLKRVYIFCIWAAGCAGMKFGRGWLKDCTTAMSLKIWKFWWARCLRNCLPRGYG